MRTGLMTTALAVAFGGAMLAGPVLADTKAGVDAWERGDYRTAVEEWRKAANAGDADAQFNMGQAYKLGRGVPVDFAAAEGWYQKAAAQGHVQAQDNYGLALFQNGRPRDAIPYLEKSVARGEPRAQYILGTMLFNGGDIKKDWVRAYALTSRASQAGLPQATQSLQQMDAYVSATDRQQGLALAQQMDGAGVLSALPSDVAGRGGAGGMRGVDLPPSTVGQRAGGLPPAPTYRAPPPAPVYRAPPPPSVSPARPVAVAQRPAPVPNPGASGRWQLQLGAFGEPGNARKLWTQVGGRFPGGAVNYVKAGSLTKVLVGPFASKSEAAAACGSIKPCVPVGP